MITRKQKKYINKHIKNTSISEIAKTIRISEPELENYLKNKFPGQKFESTLSRQHPLLKQKILNNINNFTLSRFIKSGFPIIFLLIFITVVIYSPSINGEFLSDDTTYIVKNPDLGSFDFITKRPTTFLRVLTDWTIYKIFGLNPLPYHIINLFFHITVSLCIYFIIYIIGNPVWAFLSSALVATHPIFIEGVSWITGGVYTMYGMFFFLSLLFYLLSYKFKGLYLISLLLFISSLITSEKAFVLGIAFLLLEWSLKSLKSNWRRAVPFIVSSMFSLLFIFVFTRYFAERLSVLTGMHDRGGAIYNPLVLVPTAISEYLKLIFWPSNLSLFHVLHTLSPQEYIARLIVLSVY